MWVLPSRGRPRNLKRLIAAWNITGATTPLWLRLDDDDATLRHYFGLSLPVSWRVEVNVRRSLLSEVYDEVYRHDPECPWWGFIADDVVPETSGWDTRLINIAGHDGMAVPMGGHDPQGTPHFVLGGNLVRDVGWLALPGLDRLYIDTVWAEVARSRGVLRRVSDVVLSHRHFSTGMAYYDEVYRKRRKGQDLAIYQQWLEKVS